MGMRSMQLVVSATAMTACLVSVDVSAVTGRSDLEKWCTHGTAVASGTCFGYLLAAQDALTRDRVMGVRACLPVKIELPEKHRIVLDWLKENPQVKDGSVFDLVVLAYTARYPCAVP